MEILGIGNQEFKDLIEKLKEKDYIKSQKDLAEAIGETSQGITDLKSGKKKVTGAHLKAMQEAFPSFNIQDFFLNKLSGFLADKIKNKMESSVSGFSSELERNYTVKKQGIPYYDFEASGGPVEMFNDHQEIPSQYIVIPGMEDCNVALNVWGDSMYPHFTAGDIAVCRKVNDKSLILFGEIYLVITAEFRTIKYLQKHEDRDYVTLRSSNRQNDDVEIRKDQILHLYMVKGKIQRKTI